MLKPRLPVARSLSFCLWLGSIAAVAIWGCQGPDTFIRKPASGLGGSSFGSGGHLGAGGSAGGSFGSGGFLGAGGAGMGGHIGIGGSAVGGMTGTGGTTGSGGA